jgi:hypothetical protein
MHLKKVIQEKQISYTHKGPPVLCLNSFFLNNSTTLPYSSKMTSQKWGYLKKNFLTLRYVA